ncbi:hypothetical protein [Duganella violaceipulchra]|uniref:Uncharacterized protein n=1 Tax=Duganella violaceipulchra TaxID=2849652 RepID=A0AA41L036_9BURK|nr:hypothetical protein [Duganella violaceicalia]MBV6321911.1 hypothetical protein [Duganella violaceicalia]MCP2007095.1 hypothetical protein [Duganella violaceicalia]
MTFDAKTLLAAPLVDLTVDGLAAALATLQAAGFGGAGVKLPGGAPVRKLNLAAHGEQAAHFVLTDGALK